MRLLNKTAFFAASMLVLLGAGIAQGALLAVEEAYELSLAAVSLPGNENGYLMVRRCARCKPEVLRVNAQTLYIVRPARSPVALQDLKTRAGKIVARQQAAVYVYYDPGTRYVRRLVLDAPVMTPGSTP